MTITQLQNYEIFFILVQILCEKEFCNPDNLPIVLSFDIWFPTSIRYWSWMSAFYSVVVVIVGSCPGGEAQIVLRCHDRGSRNTGTGNGWALFLSGALKLSMVHGSCPRTDKRALAKNQQLVDQK